MKLYWADHTCAIGIHVLLEEIGEPYTLEKLVFSEAEHYGAAFKAVNPKEKLPTLERDDGSVLTEYGTIAAWLASTYRAADLLPFHDLERQTRMYEALDYAVGTIHGKAFVQIFKPAGFATGAADAEDAQRKVKAQGVRMAEAGFEILAKALGSGPWLAGEQFTIGDTALFYTARWASGAGVTLPANVAGHLARMKARPSVAKVMAAWGES